MDDLMINFMRLVCAELHSNLTLTLSRDMLGKAYTSLAPYEKAIVDRAAADMAWGNYHQLTAEALKGQEKHPTGFDTSPRS